MKRYIWQILLCAILAALLFSCSPKNLSKTGNYYVKNVDESKPVYQFYFVKGKYLITDSILPKKNDKVRLTGTRDLSKVNVFRLP